MKTVILIPPLKSIRYGNKQEPPVGLRILKGRCCQSTSQLIGVVIRHRNLSWSSSVVIGISADRCCQSTSQLIDVVSRHLSWSSPVDILTDRRQSSSGSQLIVSPHLSWSSSVVIGISADRFCQSTFQLIVVNFHLNLSWSLLSVDILADWCCQSSLESQLIFVVSRYRDPSWSLSVDI